MKRCCVLLLLCMHLTMWAQNRPIDALAHRILGERDTQFVFAYAPDTLDYFQLSPWQGKIKIIANNDNSLARGLNYYLMHYAGVYVSWFEHETIELPDTFPAVHETIRKEALVKERFFLNYCTYGYTMPWWSWKQWERFIDWMALQGINMPLALTGQEAVWLEVWKEFGLTEEEILNFFSGPAHLPWHRMANLDGFGGPLPISWIHGQKALQKQIVDRERELNMTAVLPAFAGHVPKRLAALYPEADIKPLSAWCGFAPTYFLNSSDPLFDTIQRRFIELESLWFGSDHVYGVDPFNEMDPPHWDVEYLSDVSENMYYSLRKADKDARWLQMTWVFYYKRKMWTTDRLRAYLTAVPPEKLILLDYFCENTEVWRTTEHFFQQPFIWCYLGNFGGNTMLVGDINAIENKMSAALNEAGANMIGMGSTLESFDVSPQIFAYIFDRMWENNPSTNAWIEDWAVCRTGEKFYASTWQQLKDSIYKDWSFYGLGTQLVARPSLEGHGTYYTKPNYSYDNNQLQEVCSSLIHLYIADPSDFTKALKMANREGYRYDMVNFFSQWLGNHFMNIRDSFTVAFKNNDLKKMKQQVKLANHLFDAADNLLNTHTSFMLGNWITQARSWGTTEQEKNYFEQQARTILTIWGGPILNDYANRMWGGLVKDYYAQRWNLFFKAVIRAQKSKVPFDEKRFNDLLTQFENNWVKKKNKFPNKPVGNTYVEARKIYEQWMFTP